MDSSGSVLTELESSGLEKRLSIFRSLPISEQKEVLLRLPEAVAENVLSNLGDEEIVNIVRRSDPDEGADILFLVEKDRRGNILGKVESDRRKRINFLLGFNPETAAGLMDLGYVTVDEDSTFAEVSGRIGEFEEKRNKFPTVLVVKDGSLVGELPGHALSVQERPGEKIVDHVKTLPQIRYDKEDEEVAQFFRDNPHSKAVVLGEDDSILGVIRSEDVLRLIDETAGETLYDFASVSEEEHVWDPPLEKVRNRYKWLILNLGTAFLAASVVSLFQETIEALVLLAVYMPIVAGMGGNAGTQTMAVTIRGLTLGEVDFATGKRVILNEITGGVLNGMITGVLVSLIAIFINKSPLLGLVLGISMVVNLGIAGFFGASIPLILEKIEIDPATSATIFITTATDVLGFFVFLGLAKTLI